MTAKIVKQSTGPLLAKSFYNYMKNSSTGDTFYAGVLFPKKTFLEGYSNNLSADSEEKIEFIRNHRDSEFDYKDSLNYSSNLVTLHKVYSGGVARVVRRTDWQSGVVYPNWPQEGCQVLVKQFIGGVSKINVYRCLFSPGTPSVDVPFSASSSPTISPDGYAWKFLYSVSNSDAIKFMNETWMPVPEKVTAEEASSLTPGTSKYVQYLNQEAAEFGTVYAVQITHPNNGDDFPTLEGQFIVVTGAKQTQECIIKIVSASLDNGIELALIQPGKGMVGPFTTKVYTSYISSTNYGTVDSTYTSSYFVPYVSLGAGHGANVPDEMFASNVMVAVRNVPDGKLLKLVQESSANMIALIRNPIDATTSKVCVQDFYIACRSFNASGFTQGDELNSGTGVVVSVDEENNVYFVAQDEGTFDTTTGQLASKTVTDREVVFDSGEYLIVDWKTSTIVRSTDQVETINFVLSFK